MKYSIPWLHCPVIVVDHHHYVLPERIRTARQLLTQQHYDKIHVLHIDQHSDLHDNPYDIEESMRDDPNQLDTYTREYCTVGNFIQPILRTGIIAKVEQIRTERKLNTTDREDSLDDSPWIGYILDIDLDFRAPEMSIHDIPTSYHQTALLTKYASLITIATSPWFINQDLAQDILRDLQQHW
jgi:hypothetical protein